MQRQEISCEFQHIYTSLDAKGLSTEKYFPLLQNTILFKLWSFKCLKSLFIQVKKVK